MLKFFGISNGLSKRHSTSAFFVYKNNLIIIDCSMDTCRELMDFNLDKYKDIYVIVTHTHSDHVGGIGMLAAYLGWNKQKYLNIIMPNKNMVDLFNYYLVEIEGSHPSHYKIGVASDFKLDFEIEPIETSHTYLLNGKCFGWNIKVNDNYIIYTGDTNTIEPFVSYIRLALLQNQNVYLYTDISSVNNGAHLFIDDNISKLINISKKGVKVFLMHINDMEEIKRKIRGSNIKIAHLYNHDNYCFKNNKLVVVINGKGGCGKDTLIKGVADCYKVKNVSSIDHIKDLALQMGWSETKDAKSRTFLANLKQLSIKYNDMPLHDMIKEYEDFIDSDYEILFIHIREGEEIDKLKQFIKGIKTILVKRDETDKGVYTNDADNCVENYEYDYIFDNNGDIEERRLAFVKLIDDIRER